LNRKIFSIGVDLGGTNIKYGIVSSSGEILEKGLISSFASSKKEIILSNIKRAIATLLIFARENNVKIERIGLGCPGTVNVKTGAIMNMVPNVPQLRNVNIKKELEKHFDFPIFVDNDANLMAWAEYLFGAARGYDNCLCLTIGTGIGSGIILDGKLFRGSSFAGAEFGHTSICYDGIKCNCGNIGCVEMYASARAMVYKARKFLSEGKDSILNNMVGGDVKKVSTKLIFDAWEEKDRLCSQIVEDTCLYLGTAISSAVNLLNPEVVVIGGGVAEAGMRFIKKIEKESKKRANPSATRNLKVVKAKLGNDAGFIGAGVLKRYSSEVQVP
jgi:glucokinase